MMSGFAVLFVDPARPSRDQSVYGFPLIFHLKGSRKINYVTSDFSQCPGGGIGLQAHETLSCVRHF